MGLGARVVPFAEWISDLSGDVIKGTAGRAVIVRMNCMCVIC